MVEVQGEWVLALFPLVSMPLTKVRKSEMEESSWQLEIVSFLQGKRGTWSQKC